MFTYDHIIQVFFGDYKQFIYNNNFVFDLFGNEADNFKVGQEVQFRNHSFQYIDHIQNWTISTKDLCAYSFIP